LAVIPGLNRQRRRVRRAGIPSSPAIAGIEAGERYGVRYTQLALFIAAGQEQRLRALEAA
jgi:hypothetical protein